MSFKNVFSATVILLAVALSGCGQTGGVTNPEPSPTTSSNSTSTNNTNTGTNLTFSKVTPEREGTLNSLITFLNPSSNQSGTNTSQPQTGAPSSGVANSAMYRGNYYPQSGNFEQYVVINYEEAKKDGFKGTYLNVLNQVVKPIIGSLASDSRLVISNRNTDDTVINISTSTDQSLLGYSSNQWQLEVTK